MTLNHLLIVKLLEYYSKTFLILLYITVILVYFYYESTLKILNHNTYNQISGKLYSLVE